MGKYNRVRVRVHHSDGRLGLHERLDLVENQVPLELILGLVGAGVIGDLGVQLLDQFTDELHAVQQQADDDETGVVPELLHHQVASVLLGSAAVVRAAADRRVERVGLVKVAGLAGAKVIVVVELTDLARDLADLPPLQAVLRVEYRPGTTICACSVTRAFYGYWSARRTRDRIALITLLRFAAFSPPDNDTSFPTNGTSIIHGWTRGWKGTKGKMGRRGKEERKHGSAILLKLAAARFEKLSPIVLYSSILKERPRYLLTFDGATIACLPMYAVHPRVTRRIARTTHRTCVYMRARRCE